MMILHSLACVLFLFGLANAAPMVVDFGSEFIKVATLTREAHHFGELVLNEQSARKSDSIVAFADAKRFYNIMARNAVSSAAPLHGAHARA